MIVAHGNQAGGAGKAASASYLLDRRAARRTRLTLIQANPKGSVPDSSKQRAGKHQKRLGVIGLARDALRRETPKHALLADRTVIDGQPTVVALPRSAPLPADPAPILAQYSPFHGWPSAEILRLVAEARAFSPTRVARVVVNRHPARSLIEHDAAQTLTDQNQTSAASRTDLRLISAERARAEPLEQRRIATRRPGGTRDCGARRRDRKACAAMAQQPSASTHRPDCARYAACACANDASFSGLAAHRHDARTHAARARQTRPRNQKGATSQGHLAGARSRSASQPSSAARLLAWPA
jgi:chromosome partitioning protein